ncbi:MAG: hypothetical protein KTR23_03230 [Rhodospirillales bacterium]|nr:hypothetical protein [Rhodospirillales bacterium]
MTYKTWTEELSAFVAAFEDYLQEFPAHGWHEQYLKRYRRLIADIQTKPVTRGPGEPIFEINSAIRLLLDGRQQISREQRTMLRTLTPQWTRLERAAGVQAVQTGHSIGFDPAIYVQYIRHFLLFQIKCPKY